MAADWEAAARVVAARVVVAMVVEVTVEARAVVAKAVVEREAAAPGRDLEERAEEMAALGGLAGVVGKGAGSSGVGGL